jgi:hypothetical protein
MEAECMEVDCVAAGDSPAQSDAFRAAAGNEKFACADLWKFQHRISCGLTCGEPHSLQSPPQRHVSAFLCFAAAQNCSMKNSAVAPKFGIDRVAYRA